MERDGFSETHRETLAVFEQLGAPGEPMRTSEVASHLDVSDDRVTSCLEELADQGAILSKDVGASDRVWWRHPGQQSGPEGSFSQLVENVPGMVYRAHNEPGWPMTYVSDGCRQLTGYQPTAIESGEVSFGGDIIHPDDVDHVWESVQEGLETDGRFTIQYRIRTPAAETRWVWERGRVVDEAEDGTEVLEGLITDITELKTQARHLKQEIDDVFERVDDAFYALDTDFRFTYVNEQAEELLQHSEAQLLNERVWDMFPEATDTPAWDRFHEAMETNEPTDFEFYYEPLDIWVDAVAYPSESGLSVYFRDVTDQKERERELARQREQLAALNDINEVVQGITEAVVEQSTRTEIERVVCERLAGSDSYDTAWIGEVESRSDEVAVRTKSGTPGFVEDLSLSVDASGPSGHGLTTRAFQSGEMQVVQEIPDNPDDETWRGDAAAYGFRAAAAIPVAYDGVIYGVLNVYTDRPEAFGDDEREVVGQLGEIVGHAINALERKQALISDTVIELEFRLTDFFEEFDIPRPDEGKITFENTVHVDDNAFLTFGTATGDAIKTLEALTARVSHFDALSIVEEADDSVEFKLRLEESPLLDAVAASGGYVQQATLSDVYKLTVEVPPSVSTQRITETLQEAYPGTELRAQRQSTRLEQSDEYVQNVVAEDLTERQRKVLETAYHAGYFDWPRENTGEEIAESLGISPATLHQHLRTGEQKLLDAAFADEPERE